MRLIIKEYLASLRERNELDAIIPDLLSQIGLNVFVSPSRGMKEYGVDIAAVGKLNGDSEKVYLFSVKSGNLTRSTWSSNSDQALRPSLDQIIDSFIPHRIPQEHMDKPIVICLCFGGEINSGVRQEVSGYISKNTDKSISFEEWNGDKLSDYIEKYFMREDIAPENIRGYLRKSLAMVDEPDVSFKHFTELVFALCKTVPKKPKDRLTILRQLHIYTWILYSWAREANNIESAYLASELVLLRGWDICKTHLEDKKKHNKEALATLNSIINLNHGISNHYIDKVIYPHCGNLHSISSSISPSCPTDVNLKLFDLIGRIALCGIWTYWQLTKIDSEVKPESIMFLQDKYNKINQAIIQTINNNPMLFSPYKDEQAIDITLAMFCLSLDNSNLDSVKVWAYRLTESIYVNLRDHRAYPANLYDYAELIEHPLKNTDEYRESVTKGAILYPYLSIFSAIFNFDETYNLVKKIKSDFLSHSNFQIYFLDETSEDYLYNNNDSHGATLSHVSLDKEASVFLSEVENECELSNQFNQLTAVKYSFWPVILLACRHYQLPVPMHFLIDLYKQNNIQENSTTEG